MGHASPGSRAVTVGTKLLATGMAARTYLVKGFHSKDRGHNQLFHALMVKELGRKIPHWTPHDIRRTVSTRMESLQIPDRIIDAVQHHVKTGLKKHYNQYEFADEKLAALNVWGRELTRIVNSPIGSKLKRMPVNAYTEELQRIIDAANDDTNVVPIRRPAS